MATRRDTILLGATAFLPASAAHGADECARVPEAARARALIDLYVAAVNAHDTTPFPRIFTEDYIQHSGRSPPGLAAQVENFKGLFARMPDVRMRVEDLIVAADKVVARNTFSATHTRTVQGIAPSGRAFTFATIDIWRVEGGKLAEHWDLVDVAGMQRQLRGE